ncbi:hypothetical protein V7O66_09855 [Methanolobus sp. ZRKC3]|uniref:hypothetical protein n=1 Tax=Methanolobus sp. ZRKC3 TaxID=3125786 RepID=UPI003247B548
MNKKNIALISILLLCTIISSGCTVYSDEESFVLDAQTYVSYEFEMFEGDILDASISTVQGPIDVYVLDAENMYRYDEYLNRFEYDEYYENVLSRNIEFTAPYDGRWYLVLVNEENYDIALDISYEVY